MPHGGEVLTGALSPSGHLELVEYHSTFLDIVPDERIVLACDIVVDHLRRTVSLVTIELAASVDGTALTHTEQYAAFGTPEQTAAAGAERKGSSRLSMNGLWRAVGGVIG
ncbi:MAG: hypothetical protein ABJB03_10620 [Rhodoglobus sp.]